jgi:hypothetical protein
VVGDRPFSPSRVKTSMKNTKNLCFMEISKLGDEIMKLPLNRYTSHAENQRSIAEEWKFLSYNMLQEENNLSSKFPHYNSVKRNHCFLTSIVRRHITIALNENKCYPVEPSPVIPTNAITEKNVSLPVTERYIYIYIYIYIYTGVPFSRKEANKHVVHT